jgi:hypothetical protein
MKPDRPDDPPTLSGIVLDIPPEEGFSSYRDLIEQFEREVKKLLIPRRFLEGDTSSEAGARPVQGSEQALRHLPDIVGAGRGKHG